MTRARLTNVGLLVMAVLLSLSSVPSTAQAKSLSDSCANVLCTKYQPGTPSCLRFKRKSGGLDPAQKAVRCYIRRASIHYHVDLQEALYRAHRESNLHPWVINSSDHAGTYQMTRTLFCGTPYGKLVGRNFCKGKRVKDVRTSAKFATLAYAWIVRQGHGCNWNPPSYCA